MSESEDAEATYRGEQKREREGKRLTGEQNRAALAELRRAFDKADESQTTRSGEPK